MLNGHQKLTIAHTDPRLPAAHYPRHEQQTGLVVAFLVLLIQDPPRGINDEPPPEHAHMTEVNLGVWEGNINLEVCVYFGYHCVCVHRSIMSYDPPPP